VDLIEALSFIVGYIGYIAVVLLSNGKPEPKQLDLEGGKEDLYDDIDSVDDALAEQLIDPASSGSRPPSVNSLGSRGISRNSGVSRDSFRPYTAESHFTHHANPIQEDDSRLLGWNDFPEREADGLLACVLWWSE
jgi:hypothetical protein